MKLDGILITVAVCIATVYFLLSSPTKGITIAWLSLFSGFIFMFYVIYLGRNAKRPERRIFGDGDSVGMHRLGVSYLMGMILIGVLGIEIVVRKVGGMWGSPWFIAFHLSLVFGMVVSFLYARFVHTGLRSPEQHFKFAYAFVGFYSASFVTGTLLIFERFPLTR